LRQHGPDSLVDFVENFLVAHTKFPSPSVAGANPRHGAP
jgi:hypothetical protein